MIAFAGSDTTQDVVGALVTNYNADATYNEDANIPGVDKDSLDNILSVESYPKRGGLVTSTAATSPTTRLRAPGETLAPNGSSAGRDALKASVLAGNGSIDIARSPRYRPCGTGAGQDPGRRSSTTPSASTPWASRRPAPRHRLRV